MLKKLFISLLILTTLSSEGIINFPANIYNFYKCVGNETDLSAVKDITAGDFQAAKNYASLKFLNDLQSGFTLTLNSVKTIKADKTTDEKWKADTDFSSPSFVNRSFIASKESKFDILHMSDNSPPASIS